MKPATQSRREPLELLQFVGRFRCSRNVFQNLDRHGRVAQEVRNGVRGVLHGLDTLE